MARDVRLGNAVVGFRADVNQYIRNLDRAERAAVKKRRALRQLQRRMRQVRYRLLATHERTFFTAFRAGPSGWRWRIRINR